MILNNFVREDTLTPFNYSVLFGKLEIHNSNKVETFVHLLYNKEFKGSSTVQKNNKSIVGPCTQTNNNFTVKLRVFTSWLQKIQLCEFANAWTYCINTSNTPTREYNGLICNYQVHYVLMIQTE